MRKYSNLTPRMRLECQSWLVPNWYIGWHCALEMANRESEIDPTKDPTSTNRNCGAFYDLTLGNAESSPSKWSPRSAIWRIWYPPRLPECNPVATSAVFGSTVECQFAVNHRTSFDWLWSRSHQDLSEWQRLGSRQCHSGNLGECQFIGQLGDDLRRILAQSRLRVMHLKVNTVNMKLLRLNFMKKTLYLIFTTKDSKQLFFSSKKSTNLLFQKISTKTHSSWSGDFPVKLCS